MSINTDLLHAHQLHARLTGSYKPRAMALSQRFLRPDGLPAGAGHRGRYR